MNEDNISVVVSGSEWMGGGLGSIESAIYQLFNKATDEVIIVAYTVSTATPLLFDQLNAMLQRGIRIHFLVNRFSKQVPHTQQQFENLHRSYQRFFYMYSFTPLRDASDLHAKVIIVDRRIALVGSANLSLRGLMDNYELGIVIEGNKVIEISRAIDRLMESTMVTSLFT